MKLPVMEVLEYGVFDSRVKFPKVFKTQMRTVQWYEIEVYTEDQHGVGYLDEAVIPLRRGTFICAKPGQLRSSQLHFRCLYCHISTQDPTVIRLLEKIPDSGKLSNPDTLVSSFHKLLRLDPESYPEEQLLLYSLLLELVYTLYQNTSVSWQGEASESHRHAMERVEGYIRNNLSGKLDLEELAAEVNLSASYFHKVFCKHFGMPPGEYVLNCRISAAKSMLITGELPLGEIAYQCGFTSQSYFNYRFKQAVGQTPLQYRKTCLSRLSI